MIGMISIEDQRSGYDPLWVETVRTAVAVRHVRYICGVFWHGRVETENLFLKLGVRASGLFFQRSAAMAFRVLALVLSATSVLAYAPWATPDENPYSMGLIDELSERGTPLDFFSWHAYTAESSLIAEIAQVSESYLPICFFFLGGLVV